MLKQLIYQNSQKYNSFKSQIWKTPIKLFNKNQKVFLCIHLRPYGVKVALEVKVDNFVVVEIKKIFDL